MTQDSTVEKYTSKNYQGDNADVIIFLFEIILGITIVISFIRSIDYESTYLAVLTLVLVVILSHLRQQSKRNELIELQEQTLAELQLISGKNGQ